MESTNHQGCFNVVSTIVGKVIFLIFVLCNSKFLRRVVIINAPWFMKQLFKVARMILSERLTSKASMCMGHFTPGEEPNKLHECPWASKQLLDLNSV